MLGVAPTDYRIRYDLPLHANVRDAEATRHALQSFLTDTSYLTGEMGVFGVSGQNQIFTAVPIAQRLAVLTGTTYHNVIYPVITSPAEVQQTSKPSWWDGFVARQSLFGGIEDWSVKIGLASRSAPVAEIVDHPEGKAAHAQAAIRLRASTALPAAELAEVLRVSREAFQRWIGGGAIKPANEMQLFYLETVVRDAVRRLGTGPFQAWLRSPLAVAEGSTETPLGLLKAGRFDEFHRMVVQLPDSEPVVDGQVVALRYRSKEPEEDEG